MADNQTTGYLRLKRAAVMLATTGMAIFIAESIGLHDDWWQARAAVVGCLLGGLV